MIRELKPLKLSKIAQHFSLNLIGRDKIVKDLKSLKSARESDISFITETSSQKIISSLDNTLAGALIVSDSFRDHCEKYLDSKSFLISKDPKLAFAKLQNFLKFKANSGIHCRAYVSNKATIGANVQIGAFSVIEDFVIIGDNSVIDHNVTIYSGSKIGKNCRIQSNTVIGSQGFGLVKDQDKWIDLVHSGGVEIGNDVSIGSNVVIDAGTLDPTIISSGVKLDNLIQIAHNVEIGPNTAIAANVGIAGSTKIGANCLIGGAAMISDHLTICDGCIISGGTLIDSDIKTPGRYTSVFPFMSHSKWRRTAAKIRVSRSKLVDPRGSSK